MGDFVLMERIFSFIIFLIGIIGMTLNSSVLQSGIKGFRKDMFIYYTNLSNIAVVIYHLILFISSFYKESTAYGLFALPVMRLSVTLMILMTFVIYHFILRPAEKRKRQKQENHDEKQIGKTITNLCVHYVVPLTTFAEWIFVADKSTLKLTDGALWVVCPVAYVVFIMLRACILGRKKSSYDTWKKYPYFFIDVDEIGVARTALNIMIIGVVSVAFGMSFVFISTAFL